MKFYESVFSERINIILFIVQCWTQASKPEPLKQDTQKGKDNKKENKFIFNTLK